VEVGQFKDPLSHENLVSSKKSMAVERSYLNDVLVANGGTGDDYVQGIAGIFDNGGPIRATVAYTDGDQSQNTNFQNAPTNTSNFGAAGRVEWMVLGKNWKDYDQFTALGDKDDLLVIGAGGDYTGEFAGPKDILLHTIDAQYDMVGGLSVYAGYVARASFLNHAVAGGKKDFYDYGGVLQVGYLVTQNIEPFARWDYTHFDGKAGAPFAVPAGFKNNVHEIAVGANYYFHGHNAKITVDAGWLPNGAPFNDASGDILANQKESVIVRAQFQLLI
jgi:hypothetical protein